jgi:hypothetical protein
VAPPLVDSPRSPGPNSLAPTLWSQLSGPNSLVTTLCSELFGPNSPVPALWSQLQVPTLWSQLSGPNSLAPPPTGSPRTPRSQPSGPNSWSQLCGPNSLVSSSAGSRHTLGPNSWSELSDHNSWSQLSQLSGPNSPVPILWPHLRQTPHAPPVPTLWSCVWVGSSWSKGNKTNRPDQLGDHAGTR